MGEGVEIVDHQRARLRRNLPKMMALNFSWMFLVVMPVIVPFLRSHDLTMTRVFILQAIFAAVLVAFEIPSGYAADVLGRRRTLIAAGFLAGCAYSMLAISNSFLGFVVFEVLAALASSLFSGTDVAMVYDTLDALDDGRSEGRSRLGQRLFFSQVGESVAALLGGALVMYHLKLPAYVNAVTGWVPLLIALSLVEPDRKRLDPGRHLENLRSIARKLFRHSRVLTLVLAALVCYGVSTLLAVWSFQDYWASLGISLQYFGLLWVLYNLTVAVTGLLAHRIHHRVGTRAILVAIALMPVLGYAGMAFLGHSVVLVVAAGLTFQVGRGLTQVILRDELNSRVDAEMRATANSVSGLGVRVAFLVLGPSCGLMIDRAGYESTFSALALLFAIAVPALCLPLFLALPRR